MEITRGLVVRALAGRDMGGFFVVLSVDGGYAEIADGKRRRRRPSGRISAISSGRTSASHWTA